MKSRLMRAAVLGGTILSLAGCVTPEEIRAADEASCAGYGFQPATPEFARCLQQENLARRYFYNYDPWFYGPPHHWGGRP